MENNSEEKYPYSKRNIYTVPEGYFDVLETRIHQRTKKNENYIRDLLRVNSLRLSIAAASVLLVIFLWPDYNTSSPEQLLAEISEEQLARYLEENTPTEQDDILSYLEYNDVDITTTDLNTLNDSIL